ncbi:acetate/propionate family kinase [Amphritea balenae]|uniref:Acetate kinase n=1 Tax=Amphritea balenae TaxID=452629 RepID=A0A3P1SM89_9GAMM|nr:acetate/propionate family kinase [Amphritea balenae]RRC98371.1 acetate/propionate family kinase [Amphritea balenae]GGK81361.1 acetate kinase [Amphritea balenae]
MGLILTVNGGSSSLKCALFSRRIQQTECLYQFKLGNILNTPVMKVVAGNGNTLDQQQLDMTGINRDDRHQGCLDRVMQWVHNQLPDSRINAFGHRVVHGGEAFSDPVLITEEIMAQLEEFIPLAPLHQPYNLKLIRACQQLEPELPQIACFDTMFHIGQPMVERHYAIPRKYTEAGIHKYGFHGLSYEFIQRSLEQIGNGAELNKTIVCHLGAGASMCAVSKGKSIASTMGFTAVDGLPMGSRTGNIDPGVLLYLQRHYHMDTDQLESFLYKESGWLGVSGISSDMLELQQSDQPEAEEAIAMFAYRAALEIGRLSAALQGLEQLVFTGGVGENDNSLRKRICEQLEWLGIKLDKNANKDALPVISKEKSKVVVRVIPTNEEAMIALHTEEVLGNT